MRCRTSTKAGKPCPNGARPSGLCHIHDPAVQCGGTTKRGTRCTVATGGGRCEYHGKTRTKNSQLDLWQNRRQKADSGKRAERITVFDPVLGPINTDAYPPTGTSSTVGRPK
ncbi:hypothetical protein SAMN04487820_101316 [Actinopolyspora mzabensis]|uniref:Uncharacterized protein n=1 Tax=Actinopolyspora mzabensis TaxID=995066 RepID=A0A1G8VTV7_ACTMZ|nr:hypothetical protein SAMN04487820_101316 [Actinopolyspora mzabensis]